jgi:hypothetical protein
MNFGLARLLLCKRGEGLLPKEGWLERQFALAQNEVTQRPELRARASQFANERRRRPSSANTDHAGSKNEVIRPIFPNPNDRN